MAAGVALSLLLAKGVAGRKEALDLIPLPRKVERRHGTFLLRPETRIIAEGIARSIGEYLGQRLRPSTGYLLPVSGQVEGLEGNITLTTNSAPKKLGPEGYELEVAPEGVVVRAPTTAGLFYGTQTLLELFPPEVFSSNAINSVQWKARCVWIEDRPRFAWRGLMLDVSRHFFQTREIKQLLDAMALHKLNVFHWHLTDDQGWRIEIKKYPRLTQIGAWRRRIGFGLDPHSSHAYGPDGRYGGFYTQEEVRDIVAYAQARHILIVPEIEMPGHAGAALAAYPRLSCFPEKGKYTTEPGEDALPPVLCPGKEGTFEFLTNVLAQVMELFPGKYIDVGGDEVSTENWEVCPSCQERMREEGLTSARELEGYMLRRINRFLQAHGRVLVGWSEIAKGDAPTNAIVMDWLGDAVQAAKEGHDVVMTPNAFCYFDYYQSWDRAAEPPAAGAYLPLEKVYAFEPVPAGLPANCRKRILGGQANLWTEYMPSLRQVEYMAFPRLCAMAEVLWSPKSARNWPDFQQRLVEHLRRLDEMGINYRTESGQFARK